MDVHELPYISELRESRDYASMTPEDPEVARGRMDGRARDDPDFSWHGGETFEEVRGRVRRLKDELERDTATSAR